MKYPSQKTVGWSSERKTKTRKLKSSRKIVSIDPFIFLELFDIGLVAESNKVVVPLETTVRFNTCCCTFFEWSHDFALKLISGIYFPCFVPVPKTYLRSFTRYSTKLLEYPLTIFTKISIKHTFECRHCIFWAYFFFTFRVFAQPNFLHVRNKVNEGCKKDFKPAITVPNLPSRIFWLVILAKKDWL